MPEVRISEIQKELVSPEASDKLEIVDVDGNSGDPQTKFVKVENLAGGGGGAEFFDDSTGYDAGTRVLYSSNSNSVDGTYDNTVDDYRFFIVQEDISANVTPDSDPSKFQQVIFVNTDDSLDGNGAFQDLSVNIDFVDYPSGGSTTEDSTTIEHASDALDFLINNFNIPIVDSDNDRSNLDQTVNDARFIYNKKGDADVTGSNGTFEYYDGSWSRIVFISDSTGGRITGDNSRSGIITQGESQKLVPNVIAVDSTGGFITKDDTNNLYRFNFSHFQGSTISEKANNSVGNVIRLDSNAFGSNYPFRVDLPTDVDWFEGYHLYFISFSGSKKIEFRDDGGNGNVLPFNKVDGVSKFMLSIYNIKPTVNGSPNLWSIIGNVIDAT